MKTVEYLFGAGTMYAIYLVLIVSGGMYLLSHIPETFDLGYAGLVFTCLFTMWGVIRSVSIVRKNLNDYLEFINLD
jgi:hypothetical protein